MSRAMKESGIEWIGQIPQEWKIKKLKYTAQFIQNKYSETDGNINYIGLENIVSWNGKYIKTNSQYDKEQSLICETNDILFGKLRPYLAKVYISERKQCCSGEFAVIRAGNKCINRYLWYQLISHGFIFMVDRSTYGTKMPRANVEFIKNVGIAIPTKAEQQKIVSHLDAKCAAIDDVISKTAATIEEYKKLKQSIITEAVTKGIRGNRPMKDSGIEWIGEIPEEWEFSKTLHYLSMPITDGPHTTPELFDTGIAFVSAEAVSCGNGHIDFSHIRGYISEEFYNECCQKYIPEIDDIYMIKSGATTGRVSIVNTLEPKFTIWSPLAVFRCNKDKILPMFMYYSLQTEGFQKQIEFGWTFGTQQNIGMRTLEQLKIFVPSIIEQQEIVEYLDSKCSEIDKLIESKQKIIEELQAYKKSVIYEYVTGKKEVQ